MNFEIIELNSYGPYNHGTWENPKTGQKIGKEEFLTGRSNYIFEKFCKFMEKFTEEQIANMTAIDIGSYDGWFAHEISKKYNFKKIVSSEPRLKNINKGKAVRNFLKIESSIETRQENLEEISEQFDIVICIGVLHHVDSISRVIKKLSSIAEVAIFIETQIYEPPRIFLNNSIGKLFLSKHNDRIIEPKDIVYLNHNGVLPKTALSGHKYESSYFDGSTSSSQVVELPSVDGLSLNLTSNNFFDIKILATSKEYGKILKRRKFRVFKATIMSAIKTNKKLADFSEARKSIHDYEVPHFMNLLSEDTIKKLQIERKLSFKHRFVLHFLRIPKKYLFNPLIITNLERLICKFFRIRHSDLSTLSILQFDFPNKFTFEVAKYEIVKRNYENAEILLEQVITSNNADWRSTYRGFFLLYLLAIKNQDEVKSERYLSLLRTANIEFPIDIAPVVSAALGLR